jgi:O-antigen ligase/tetratricopeptide (TPR) repeat protein
MSHEPNPSSTIVKPAANLADRCLLRTVDAGLAGCFFIAPLLLGGRHPTGQLILVGLAVLVTLAWWIRACLVKGVVWRFSGAEVLLLAAVGLVTLQIAPLPEEMLRRLSPRIFEILPLWASDSSSPIHLGSWNRISLTPAATAGGLVLLLSYVMLFWVTVQRIQKVDDVRRLLRWCAWAALAMAGFGLLQWLFGNGKFFWFYDAPLADTSDAAKGSFLNRNHFAHFLALSLGAVIWWIEDARTRGPSAGNSADWATPPTAMPVRWIGLGVVLFAGLLSLSRGGMAVMLLAVAVMVLVCYRARVLRGRLVVGAMGVVIVVGAALSIHGHDLVSQRLDSVSSGSVDTLDPGQRRRIIWSADLEATRDFPIVGTGVGSHRRVCPMYLDPEASPAHAALSNRVYFSHAENGPLQVAMETGAPGLVLLICVIALVSYWCLSTVRRTSSRSVLLAMGAIISAGVVSLAHSMVDFVWYVPACTAVVTILAGAACRLHQITREASGASLKPWSLRLGHGLAALVMVGSVGGWMLVNRWGPAVASPHWDLCQRLVRASAVEPDRESPESTDLTDQDADENATVAVHPLEKPLENIIAKLEETVRLDPTHVEARLQLAGSYLLLFEYKQKRSPVNAMPLSAVREAVLASQFESRAELDAWLGRAVGKHARYLDLALRHTRIALRHCPLEGAGYLHLGELAFLDGVTSRQAITDGVAQSLRVRPHDGGVLVSVGQEAAIAGNLEEAVEYWRRAYRLGPACQKEVIRRLAGKLCPDNPATDVNFFLDTFAPDLTAVRLLERIYRGQATDEELGRLRDRHAELAAVAAEECKEGSAACLLWMEARLAHVRRGRSAQAVDCLRAAVRRDPNNATARTRLADGLLEQGQFIEAEKHLQWSLVRNPRDGSLRVAIRRCTEGRLQKQKSSKDIGDRMETRR